MVRHHTFNRASTRLGAKATDLAGVRPRPPVSRPRLNGLVPTAAVAAIGILGVAALLAGCRSDGTSTSTPSRPAASTSTNARDVAAQAALAAYRGMWDAFVRAAETSDYQSQELRRYADGAALQLLVKSLLGDYDRGYVTKGTVTFDPKVTDVQPPPGPNTVAIRDCADDINWLKYHRDTGQLVNDVRGGRRLVKATVNRTPDGAWKVTNVIVEGIRTC